MHLTQEVLDWQRVLQERWNSDSPTRFVPLDRYHLVLDIKVAHLKPAQLSTDRILDWSCASDVERTTYQEFVAGIIDAAVDRKTGTLAHVDIEVERAIWSVIHVCKKRGKMTPYLHGWTCDYTFGPGFALTKRQITQSTLGREGAACWNTDAVGPRRYVPPALQIESTDVHKDFVKRMRDREEQYLGYDMVALADISLLKLFDKQLQKEMVQTLRDIHAKRLIERIAFRNGIPKYWSEHATLDFPENDRMCALHGVSRTQISRTEPSIWSPLSVGEDAHLANQDFSAGSWSRIWKEHPVPLVSIPIAPASTKSASVSTAPVEPATTAPTFEASLAMHPARRAMMENAGDVTMGGVA